MIILDKEGSLRASGEYASIYLEPAPYNIWGIPYFAKVSEIREIIYCAEGTCNRTTYLVWRNMIYKAGYAESMIGEHRRRLATSEL